MASKQKPLAKAMELAEKIVKSHYRPQMSVKGWWEIFGQKHVNAIAAILDPVLQKHLRLLRGYQKVLKVKYGPGVGDWDELMAAIHELEGGGDVKLESSVELLSRPTQRPYRELDEKGRRL